MPVQTMSELLEALGGVATYRELASAMSRSAIERALATGKLVRQRRDRYVSPRTATGRRIAHELTATLSHESAALHHGWPVRFEPERPQVIIRRKRRLSAADQRRADCHYRDLDPDDVERGVTTPVRTVLDCARDLSFPSALTVADSALRQRAVDQTELRAALAALPARLPGRARAERVIDAASPRAAGPLESALRAEVMDVRGFCFEPQVQIAEIGLFATVDLADRDQKVALEAEGYAFHGGRREFRRDCARYDELVVYGWRVFRFAWEHVMLRPAYVRWCLEAWTAVEEGQPVPRPPS